MANALITIAKSARSGDIIEVKALLQHPMETGYRRSSDGVLLPRNLVRTFSCRLLAGRSPSVASASAEADNVAEAGDLVFAATLHAAVAANPYLSFNLRATVSGTLLLVWEGDQGFMQRETVYIDVT